MTETATSATVNRPQAGEFRFGSVGKPMQGVEVRIADDGEVLVKGPNIFQGYYKNEEATRNTIEGEERWLHTGDLGRLDDDGFLYITGRKKDIIITAGGKNITPANLENGLKQSRWISQAVVVGDRRPYLIALITLDPEEAPALAEQLGLESSDLAEMANEERVRAEVQKTIDEVNSHVGPVEQIKRFAILDHDLSQETGELTPTLKVKRNVVHEKYAVLVDEVYERTPGLRLAGQQRSLRYRRPVHRPPSRHGAGPLPGRCGAVLGAAPAGRRAARPRPAARGARAVPIAVRAPARRLAVDRLAGRLPDGLRDRGDRHGDDRLPRVADAHDGPGQAGGSRLEARPARRRAPPGARRARADLRSEPWGSPSWHSGSGSSSSRARVRASPRPTSGPRVGFRDYYRQFEDLDERELNRRRRARRHEEKRQALERVPDLDLSGTEWPDLPHSEIANAAIARARGLRAALSGPSRRRRSGGCWRNATSVDPERIALGNGAAELLQAAAFALLSEGDELVMPWPSYPLYPLLAAHAGARPVAVERGDLLDAVGERTRVRRASATRTTRPASTCTASRAGRPARGAAGARARCCSTRRSCTSRTSRPWTPASSSWRPSRACSWCARSRRSTGCRACGPATRSPPDGNLLAAVAPVLGVNALTQAAIEHALRTGDAEVERRRQTVGRERAPAARPRCATWALDVTDSQANFVWLRVAGRSGDQLASRTARAGRDRGARRAARRGPPRPRHDHLGARERPAAAGARERARLRVSRRLSPRPTA